jgi:hypothetical protein
MVYDREHEQVEAIKWLPAPRDLGQSRDIRVYKVKAHHPPEVFFELGMEKIKEKISDFHRDNCSGNPVVSVTTRLGD